jgi:Outer membrane protein beta-barrel domain
MTMMPPEQNFYFGLFGGLTGGGDKLATVRFNDGSTESINAGGLVHLGLGIVWQPALSPMSVQATIGWHGDTISADNGDLRFTRVPIELLGYIHPAPHWRFGGGVRWVTSPELKADVDGFDDSVRFKDTTGAVVEAGYRIGGRTWLNLRYTVEDYEAESVNGVAVVPTGKSSARSIGLNVMFLF